MAVLKVTDDTTREDLAITLGLLNQDAKALSRRGRVGQASRDYARLHDLIDSVLDDWQRAKED